MKLEFITVTDIQDKPTGKLIVFINTIKPKEKQLVLEMEKLLDQSSILVNSLEHDTYNGFGISYVTHTGYRADVRKLYRDTKPLAQDAIDRRELDKEHE